MYKLLVMKNWMSLCLLFLFASQIHAKKVKFSVDMTGQNVSINGVHIVGDFQALAGLGADWDPATALMNKEGTTNIYSIIVNIPAHRKYEYRFVNGDLSYEAEFVPNESRVGYNFVDNRWLYVDSLANDTTFAGAIMYSGNAPSGKTLVRYKLNTNHLGSVPASGFHVAGSFQNFDPTKIKLCSFGNGIYEIIQYVNNGSYQHKFYNGNTTVSAENLPGSCTSSGNRTLTVTKDTVLAEVCFSECLTCQDVGINTNNTTIFNAMVYPNPAANSITISLPTVSQSYLIISDISGKQLLAEPLNEKENKIQLNNFEPGVYFVRITNAATGQIFNSRLIIE